MTRPGTRHIQKNPGPTSAKALLKGSATFGKMFGRDAIYNSATLIVDTFWEHPTQVTNGLGVLLEVWNKTFYRFNGELDYDALEACIKKNRSVLETFRPRNILDYEPAEDDPTIRRLFEDFLKGVRSKNGRRCAVAVSKTFHVIAPAFFPLWDVEIAKAYGCYYDKEPADKYLCFMVKSKEIAERFADQAQPNGKPLLKLIDEFNFINYTIEAKRRKGKPKR